MTTQLQVEVVIIFVQAANLGLAPPGTGRRGLTDYNWNWHYRPPWCLSATNNGGSDA